MRLVYILQAYSYSLLMVTSITISHAQNLVPNGNFEDFDSCPSNNGEISVATHWNHPTEIGIPDYFSNCAGNSCEVCVPDNFAGSELPLSGSGYAGFAAYVDVPSLSEYYAEYLQTRLTETLQKDAWYEVTFSLSLADGCIYAFDELGIYFSNNQINADSNLKLSQYSPQVVTANAITEKEGWVQVKECFVASGGEQYITIGAFDTSSQKVTWVDFGSPNPAAYYYIDNVSVTLLSKDTFSGFKTNEWELCKGESLTLKATTDSARYLWQDGTTSDSFRINKIGTYWVEVSTLCQADRDTIIVKFPPSPLVKLKKDSICIGDTLTLQPDSFPYSEYRWNTGETTPFIFVTQQDTIQLLAGRKCYEDQFDFEIYAKDRKYPEYDTTYFLCEGDTLQIGDTTSNALSYLWQNGSDLPYFIVTKEGTYTVKIETECWTDTFEQNILKIQSSRFSDTAFCGEAIMIDKIDKLSQYIWPDGSTGNSFLIEEDGTYNIDVQHPCERYQDTIEVSCSCLPFIPNSFTPNGDGQNDQFRVTFECKTKEFELSIFDKFGALIFNTNNLKEGWDGIHQQQRVNGGVYVYAMHLITNDNAEKEIYQTGNFLLVR